MRSTLVLCLGSALGCVAAGSATTEQQSTDLAEVVQSPRIPTREDFFREVLEPQPLPTSASFHDYAPNSYHVDKLAFWTEFPSFARSEGHDLRAIVILGPTGPLWTYHVFAFLKEDEMVRVNQVVFPHARLTRKQTGLLPHNQAEHWLTAWSTLPEVREIEPDPKILERLLPANSLGDFRFDLLVVYPIEPTRAYVSGEQPARPRPQRPELEAHLNELISKLEPTYEHGDDVRSESKP